MIVAELIAKLQAYPPSMRVTLFDPDTDYLLPIRIVRISAEDTEGIEFVAVMGDRTGKIEGYGPYR